MQVPSAHKYRASEGAQNRLRPGMTSQKGKHPYPSPICQSRPLRPRDSPKQPDLPAHCRCSRYRKGEHSGLTALIPAPTTGSQSPAQACRHLKGRSRADQLHSDSDFRERYHHPGHQVGRGTIKGHYRHLKAPEDFHPGNEIKTSIPDY